jgi:Zn-finger nucleic acid-binding protein
MFGWLRRRKAASTLRDVCGFVDVERFNGGVRSVPLSVRDARVVSWSDDDKWKLSIRGVNAPSRLLHPSANTIVDDTARTALDALLRSYPPHEVEVVDGALAVTFERLPEDWHGCESAVLALADALRVVGAATTSATTAATAACPTCGAALRDRGGLASCNACKGRLVAGDVARERIFDPRNIDPGTLKDASVGRGLVARCPSCAHPMAPVLVDDVVVDVCKGCGALWCDEGEHARLMGGMT